MSEDPKYHLAIPISSSPPGPPSYNGVERNVAREGSPRGAPKSEIGFDDKSIRADFVRKVFSLVALMFGAICIAAAIPFIFDSSAKFVNDNPIVFWISILVFILTYIPIAFFRTLRRVYPWNILTAAVLTLSASYLVAAVSAYSGLNVVLIAAGITFVCCLLTVLFACQTKYDLSCGIGGTVFACIVLSVATVMAVICIVALKVGVQYVLIGSAAAMVLIICFAINIQMILGGKRSEISPEDHVYAAIQLFVDILLIFLFVLVIVVALASCDSNGSDGGCNGGSSSGGGSCNCGPCDCGSSQRNEEEESVEREIRTMARY